MNNQEKTKETIKNQEWTIKNGQSRENQRMDNQEKTKEAS
jgi:hypothetical protein